MRYSDAAGAPASDVKVQCEVLRPQVALNSCGAVSPVSVVSPPGRSQVKRRCAKETVHAEDKRARGSSRKCPRWSGKPPCQLLPQQWLTRREGSRTNGELK